MTDMDVENKMNKWNSTDYLIVGSGIAGLYSALLLARYGKVLVLCKRSALESNTWLAQGGIAAVFGEKDSLDQHMVDTITAGAEFNDRDAVKMMVEEGPGCIYELEKLGVDFDRQGDELALGQEGAHTRRRVLRIGGDATGRFLVQSLTRLAYDEDNITIVEDAFALDLLGDENECKGVRWTQDEQLYDTYCKAVVLSTGGGGYLYWHTTNPETATADGSALAYKAGAGIGDLEFVQFHPTVFFKGEKAFLISEAVRGEGAYLVNEKGERFMKEYHPDEELGPRDVVSRAMMREMEKYNQNVYLDLRHLDGKYIKERFPTIYTTCYEWGVDITSERIPICPAAHYFIGGIVVDSESRTGVNRLFAVGEAAATGVHGANRLASNSLLEALVFSKRAANFIGENQHLLEFPVPFEGESFRAGVDTAGEGEQLDKKVEKGLDRELDREVVKENEAIAFSTELRKMMWQKVGLFRQESTLQEAVAQLDKWIEDYNFYTQNPRIKEVQNMLLTSRLLAEAALQRRESRGCHYRDDYPEVFPEENYHLIFQRGSGFKGVKQECLFPPGLKS